MVRDYEDDEEEMEDEDEQQEEAPRSRRSAGSSNLDPNAFADALLAKIGSANSTKKEDDADVKELLRNLKSQGYSDEYLNAVLVQHRANQQMLKNELDTREKNREMESIQRTLKSEARREIKNELKSLYRDVPELREFDDELRVAVDAVLKNDTKFWEKWAQGEVDEAAIEKAVDKASKKFLKLSGSERAREKDPNPAARPSSATSSKGKSIMSKGKEVTDEDDLEEHQLEAYYSFLHTNTKKLGKSPEEAKKDALAVASRLPRKRAEKSVLD